MATGCTAAGIPGTQLKAIKPVRIKRAEVAGSRPDTKRGSQKASMIPAPMAASRIW
jgi:hypothetical protein